MSSMDELTAFLRARYDEAEAAAGGPPGWKLEHWTVVRYGDNESGRNWRIDAEPRCVVDGVHREDAAFIVLNDPAAALADLAAKRAILALHDLPEHYCPLPVVPGRHGQLWTPEEGPCWTLRLLTEPYAGHPDYRQEWKP